MKILLAWALLILTPTIALADPGHELPSTWDGVVHLFQSPDHIIVMAALGTTAIMASTLFSRRYTFALQTTGAVLLCSSILLGLGIL